MKTKMGFTEFVEKVMPVDLMPYQLELLDKIEREIKLGGSNCCIASFHRNRLPNLTYLRMEYDRQLKSIIDEA